MTKQQIKEREASAFYWLLERGQRWLSSIEKHLDEVTPDEVLKAMETDLKNRPQEKQKNE